MKFLEGSKKFVLVLSRISSILAYAGYLLMILITVVDVVLRYAINSPILGSYEIIQYLLLVSTFASFSYCQMLRGHIQVTMILRTLPRRMVFILYTLTGILTTAIMAFVGYAASQQALYAMSKGLVTDTLGFPTAPFIWIECVCMFIFALACLVDVLYSAAAIFHKPLQEQLLEEWN
ncbi:MAG: TRAP transporter small permease [Oscillospiraceae bacterium]|nr:TRAP transporter small permease [Oscillospiraceae bacterium]